MRNPVSTLRFTEIELLTDRDYIDDAIELYLVGTSPDGRRHIANLSGLEWKTPASGEYTRDRALNLPSKEALRFLSAFIVAGGKLGLSVPEEAGKLKATQGHLEDMRKIAFQLLSGASS